jgi:glycosyltransferase involved in cell wall biosynthesis
LTEPTNAASEYVPRILRVHAEDEVASASFGDSARASHRPLLSVVVPVYNGGDEIVDNIAVVRAAVTADLDDRDVEIIVVSDGSIDGTAEALLAARADVGIRVIHYDRNLGKGYAVKLGSLASTGVWVAIVDADLDLHPSAIPSYLEAARRENLDFAVGSKRHPDSVVYYPRSRRMASWMYQQLNRILFRLDVRDTQVGLKVFRGEVADEVVPLLLVKRFAFDLELLAVGRALGFERMKEMPVRLDYRFTGSAVRSRAVVRALVDTLAIFYRLRILRTYQRKRAFLPRARRSIETPLVSVIADEGVAERLDWPQLEVQLNARAATGELLAIAEPGARPAGNWVTAATPYFGDEEVAAVVAPAVAPTDASIPVRIAAAVLESRIGGGSRRSRFLPGNVRIVTDHSAENVVVRRTEYLDAVDDGIDREELVAWLARRGRKTIYTPDTSVSASPSPFAGPHLRGTVRHARARGRAARASKGRSIGTGTALSFALPAMAALAAFLIVVAGSAWTTVGWALLLLYVATLAASATLAGIHFRSVVVGAVTPVAVIATQAAYVVGFLQGLARRVAGVRSAGVPGGTETGA